MTEAEARWLRERGHRVDGGACEVCWSVAGWRALADPNRSRTDHYKDVLAESLERARRGVSEGAEKNLDTSVDTLSEAL